MSASTENTLVSLIAKHNLKFPKLLKVFPSVGLNAYDAVTSIKEFVTVAKSWNSNDSNYDKAEKVISMTVNACNAVSDVGSIAVLFLGQAELEPVFIGLQLVCNVGGAVGENFCASSIALWNASSTLANTAINRKEIDVYYSIQSTFFSEIVAGTDSNYIEIYNHTHLLSLSPRNVLLLNTDFNASHIRFNRTSSNALVLNGYNLLRLMRSPMLEALLAQ
uniref:Uncharacterized protein n=1 Tax=Ditylenchus dipsaci TaxID=166011 RepID=A0A915ESU9_9BILA